MRIGSLFSGGGMLDVAATTVFGGEVAWHAEVDPAASRVLARHWPRVSNHGDITRVDWRAVDPVDVLTGGFPCQDVSAAGRRAGLATGTRSGLWSHMATAIDVLRPRYVLIENVTGLLHARAIRDMESGPDAVGDDSAGSVLRAAGAVLGDLASLGFDAEWLCLRASAIGFAHHRARVVILAYPADTDRDTVREQPITIPGRSGPALAGWDRADSADTASIGLAGLDDRPSSTPACGRRQRDTAGSPGRTPVPELKVLPTPTASDGSGGGQHPDRRAGHSRQLIDHSLLAGAERWGDYEPAIRRQEHITGRPAPSPTEPNTKGRPRLSAAFAEWLMGWPPGWVTNPALGLSRVDQLRLIGNGVIPHQIIAATQALHARIPTLFDLEETAHA